MTEYASTDDLIAGEDPAEDLPLPSGRTVRVRGLSRYEWFLVGKRSSDNGNDGNVGEILMIKMGLVEPKMTDAQVTTWRKRSGAGRDIAAVSDRIRELTGVSEGADKSPVRTDGDES